MRQPLFLRWLRTQWTAVPLAFLIVTAFEVWRLEDGKQAAEAAVRPPSDDAAVGPPPANAAAVRPPAAASLRPPAQQHPAPSNIDQNATGVGQKPPPPPKDIAARAVSAGSERRPWRRYGQEEILVNASRPVVNPHPFQYIINCPDLCRGVDVFLLNYVHTAVDHFTRRVRIRKMWALQSHYPNFTIRTVFFVGLTDKSAWLQDALAYESRKYGDIVQKDFLDTYKSVNVSFGTYSVQIWLTGLFRCNKRTSTLDRTNQNKTPQ